MDRNNTWRTVLLSLENFLIFVGLNNFVAPIWPWLANQNTFVVGIISFAVAWIITPTIEGFLGGGVNSFRRGIGFGDLGENTGSAFGYILSKAYIIIVGPFILWIDGIIGLNMFPKLGASLWNYEFTWFLAAITLFVFRGMVGGGFRKFHTLLLIILIGMILTSYVYENNVIDMHRLNGKIKQDQKLGTVDVIPYHRPIIEGPCEIEITAKAIGDIDINFYFETDSPGVKLNINDIKKPNNILGDPYKIGYFRPASGIQPSRKEPHGMLFFYIETTNGKNIPVETSWEENGTHGGKCNLRIPSNISGKLSMMVNDKLNNARGEYAIKYIYRKTQTQKDMERTGREAIESVFSVFGSGKENDNSIIYLKRVVGKHGDTFAVGPIPRNGRLAVVLRNGQTKPGIVSVVTDNETEELVDIKISHDNIILLRELKNTEGMNLKPTDILDTGGELSVGIKYPANRTKKFSLDIYCLPKTQ